MMIDCEDCQGIRYIGFDFDGNLTPCESCANTEQMEEDDLSDAALALDRIVWANSGRRHMTEEDMDEAVAALEEAIQALEETDPI